MAEVDALVRPTVQYPTGALQPYNSEQINHYALMATGAEFCLEFAAHCAAGPVLPQAHHERSILGS
jgi:hypothetical protein